MIINPKTKSIDESENLGGGGDFVVIANFDVVIAIISFKERKRREKYWQKTMIG